MENPKKPSEGVLSGPKTALDFSQALIEVRLGNKIARKGWNGNGQWVVFQQGYPNGIPINGNTARATGIPEGTIMSFKSYLMFKTQEGEFVPWVATQTDLLAMDWYAWPVESEQGDRD